MRKFYILAERSGRVGKADDDTQVVAIGKDAGELMKQQYKEGTDTFDILYQRMPPGLPYHSNRAYIMFLSRIDAEMWRHRYNQMSGNKFIVLEHTDIDLKQFIREFSLDNFMIMVAFNADSNGALIEDMDQGFSMAGFAIAKDKAEELFYSDIDIDEPAAMDDAQDVMEKLGLSRFFEGFPGVNNKPNNQIKEIVSSFLEEIPRVPFGAKAVKHKVLLPREEAPKIGMFRRFFR